MTSNTLKLYGETATLLQFYDDNSLENGRNTILLTFNKQLEGNGREERRSKWGTPEDAYHVSLNGFHTYFPESNFRDSTLLYIFDTFQSAPLNWVKYMGEKYRDIRFELSYEEELTWGQVIYQDGALESHRQGRTVEVADVICQTLCRQSIWKLHEFLSWHHNVMADVIFYGQVETSMKYGYITFSPETELLLASYPIGLRIDELTEKKLMLLFCDYLRKLLKLQRCWKSTARRWRSWRQKHHHQFLPVMKELDDWAWIPPVKEGSPIFARGGAIYREGLLSWSNSI